MINRKGFSLVEMLGCVALLGLILAIGMYISKDTLSTTLTQTSKISDNEIMDTAKIYVIEKNISWNNGYICVTVEELVDNGYFDSKEVDELNQIIKLTRNEDTKVISSVEYVDECN